MQKIICEEEPTKPSTKLSTLGKALTDIAKLHSSSPELMPKLVRGDLDWIVLKSLEKERTRRYDTASALAIDIQRHLDNKPVLARAPNAKYILQKFLRRHRSQVMATLAIAILIATVIIISSMWNKNRLKLAEAESLVHGSILFQARESFAKADYAEALERAKSILNSKYYGSEAKLLYAGILVEGQQSEEAVTNLEDLLDDRPEIAGAAYSLLARILWESESSDEEKFKKVDEYRQKAEELLSETAEAYFLRAMMAITIKEKLELLDKALYIDPRHYESCRLRAFTFYASRKYEMMENDARVMVVLRSQDPLGYSLWAIALRELGHYEHAIQYYNAAIEHTPEEDAQYIQLYDQRCEIYLRMGEYERAIADAQECLRLSPDSTTLKFRIFCALIALGNYEEASTLFSEIVDVDLDSKHRFKAWSMKYVFDTLEAGGSWHRSDYKPEGVAFLAMIEAEETYNQLRTKGKRLITDGFTADWSPDGTKLAFSMGVYGHSGLAIFDLGTQETELLIVPGKHPKWSPDGKHIAFVRDNEILPLSELVIRERSTHKGSFTFEEEVWIVNADGTEPRRLIRGSWPSWSQDSKHVYYIFRHKNRPLRSISIEGREDQPRSILEGLGVYSSVSPDNEYVAYVKTGSQSLEIVDLASQSLVADWVGPPRMWWGGYWSPTSRRFSLGGVPGLDNDAGLWIYDLDEKRAVKVFSGQITSASWAPDETELAICLGLPFYEIWIASLDPNTLTTNKLGSGQTMKEHYWEMINHYTRRIEANSEDADSYLRRAQFSHYVHDKQQVRTDMDKYRTILNPLYATDSPDHWMRTSSGQKEYSGFQFGTPTNLGPPINSPADEYDMSLSADGLILVFTSNRPGGSGGYDLWTSTRLTVSDYWSEPVNLGPTINTSANESGAALSADGLTLYFHSPRPGGFGGDDIYISTRETTDDKWGESVNLGSPVNSSKSESTPLISTNGLELYFCSFRRLGGYGYIDIWVSTRETKDDPWSEPFNLGPPVNSEYNENFPCLSADG
ncbi:MAG: tetratricopeptide repeat protein, partial [Planctomycetota bacterium]